MKPKRKTKKTKPSIDKVGMILAGGSVALILVIAIGAYGRAFYLAVATGQDMPISPASTQLLTGLGSAIIGGAVGYVAGDKR